MTAYDDFRFASADDLADFGGPVSRFNHNVAAIKLLKSLEAEGRWRQSTERWSSGLMGKAENAWKFALNAMKGRQ
jgi:hypothetical protein